MAVAIAQERKSCQFLNQTRCDFKMSGHDDLSNVIAGVVSLIASFSIVHIAGTRDISNNLTVTAIPRTRIGGGMARRQGIANGRDHPRTTKWTCSTGAPS